MGAEHASRQRLSRRDVSPIGSEQRERRRPLPTHTAEAYLADNRSDTTRTNLAMHHEHKAHGTLVYAVECGDARGDEPMPEQALVDRRIATGVLPEKARKPFDIPAVMFGVVIPHYAGSKTIPGKKPEGCGGHAAADALANAENTPRTDRLYTYVGNRVPHGDPVIAGLKTSRRLARTSESGKPVVLMPQDHETGERSVVGYSQRFGQAIGDFTRADFHMPLDGQYDPKLIYANGVPNMEFDSLPDNIQQYLLRYQAKLASNPVVAKDQVTQDPGVIMFTTELRDSKLWLPDTYSRPNTGFRLTLYQDDQRVVAPEDQDIALAQAWYVLRQSVDHAYLPGTPFHSTQTAAIFTDNYDFSRQFAVRLVQSAQELSNTDSKPSWFELPDRKIIVGQVHNGVIQRIGEITVGIKDGVVNKFEERELRI